MHSMKTVALVEGNPAGHHRTYFGAFASALLDNGVRVLPFCPWPEESGDLVGATLSPEGQERLKFLEPATRCWWPTASNVRPVALQPRLRTLEYLRRLSKNLRRWETGSGNEVDLVFFASIYDPQFASIGWGRLFFHRPWSGLYMDSRAIRKPGTKFLYSDEFPCPEKIFTTGGLSSVATLDEGIVDRLGAYTRGRPVVWFPDLADNRLPSPEDEDATLGAKIRQFAAGRKVVGCIGHLRKTKGLLNLVRAAADARLRDVCFAFVGEVGLDPYTAQEQSEILDAWEQNPRIFCHPMRVPDGPRLNSVLSACDVVSGAYTDFPNSSNMLTKAAAFGKSIVVNDGYLMAERVRKFGLGCVVEEDNLESLVEALASLTMRQPDAVGANPGRDLFLRQHSYSSLVEAFGKILSVGTAER